MSSVYRIACPSSGNKDLKLALVCASLLGDCGPEKFGPAKKHSQKIRVEPAQIFGPILSLMTGKATGKEKIWCLKSSM